MWCVHCQQDLPHSVGGGTTTLRCAKCGHTPPGIDRYSLAGAGSQPGAAGKLWRADAKAEMPRGASAALGLASAWSTAAWPASVSQAQRLLSTTERLLASPESEYAAPTGYAQEGYAQAGYAQAARPHTPATRETHPRPSTHAGLRGSVSPLGQNQSGAANSWLQLCLVALAGLCVMLGGIITSAAIALDLWDDNYAIGLGVAICLLTGVSLSLWQTNQDLRDG
ncbi:MAG: hypothetical protein SFX18_00325 [Pirellulales bacterium]|nr:hypothetical protein [Pirellulales bacterium]